MNKLGIVLIVLTAVLINIGAGIIGIQMFSSGNRQAAIREIQDVSYEPVACEDTAVTSEIADSLPDHID